MTIPFKDVPMSSSAVEDASPSQTNEPTLRIEPGELDIIIWKYLAESGYKATSRTFLLENTNLSTLHKFMSKHVRSGVLYDLLSDALRFREMNAHAGTAPSSGSDICRAPFLLLSEHKCSFDTGSGDSGSGVGETVGKRKEKSKGKGKEKQAGFSNLELLPPPPLPSTFHAVAKAEYSSELPEVKQRPGRSRTYPDLVPASLSEREQHLPRKIAEFGGDPSSSSTMDVDIAPASSSTTPAEPPPTPGAEWIFIPQVSNRPVPFLDRPVEIRSNTRNDRKSIFGDKVDEEKWSYAPIMMRRPPDPPTSTTSQLIDVNMNSESTLITRSCTTYNAMWGACPPRLLYLGDRIPDDLPEPITFRSLAVPDFPRDRTVRDGYDPHPLIEQLSAKPEGSSVDLDECRRWLPFGNEARECLIPVENYCKGVWCGNLWTVGYQNGRIRIWTITPSLKSITPPEVDDIKDSKIHDPPIHALTWTTHYKPALVTGAGRTITVAPPSHSPLWKVGRAVDVPKSQHQGPITDLKISPDNRWVISASTDGSCGLWSLVRREIGHEFVRLYTPPHQDKTKLFDKSYAMNSGVSITGLDWVDEKRFVVGRMSEVWNVWMYCVDAGGEVKCFQGQKGNVLELQCSPRVEGTPHLLASISADCTTGIWDLNNDDDLIVQPLRILNGQHDEEVTTLQWFTSSNFLRLATGGNDARVVIWDPLTGSCLKRFEPGALFKKPVVCMSLAPDMKSLVIGSEDNSVAMLRTQKGFAVWFRSFDMNSEQDDARAHRRIVGAKAQIDETGRLRWLACNFTTGESIVLDLAKTEQCPYP